MRDEGQPRTSRKASRRPFLATYAYKRIHPAKAPVSIPCDGDRATFRSYDKAGKAKRQRSNPTP
jgi:hypothetical protein